MNRQEFHYSQQIGIMLDRAYKLLRREFYAEHCTPDGPYTVGEYRLYEYFHDERVLRCADECIQAFYIKVSKFYQQALEQAKQGEVE